MSASATVLTPTALLDEARAQAPRLDDFGDASFLDGLEHLCDSLNHEARLSETGAMLIRHKLVTQLANRLRVEDYFRRHPEIAEESIEAPLFIVGMPRTGTTKLHRLLSSDPRFWWMSFWESQFPVPLADETLADPRTRRHQGQALVTMMTEAMPRLLEIHPMSNEAAEEEVMLMEHSMRSAFNAYAAVPCYMRWLDASDQAPAYRYLERMLRFLQWQKRQRGLSARRWVLKAPHHLLRMETLLRVFAGAQIVLTHRDPVHSVPSIASFVHSLRCIYSQQASAEAVGEEWSDIMRRALRHTMAARQSAAGRFIDIDFDDIRDQPLAEVARIYDFIGWPLEKPAREAMRQWLDEDARTHAGGHDYTPEMFGLTRERLREDFADYRRRHIRAAAPPDTH